MTLISTTQLAVIAGLRTRQIQRLLDKGVPGINATKSDGGHWIIPDTPAVRKWAKNHRRWKRPTVKRVAGYRVVEVVPDAPTDNHTVTHHVDGKLTWREGATKDEWCESHLKFIPRKRGFTKWRRASQRYASDRWGVDYVAEQEIEMELAMGIPLPPPPKPRLNPRDKSRAILTIEGISQSFAFWHRKMVAEIDTWGESQLDKAIQLLEPQARVHAELVARRDALERGK